MGEKLKANTKEIIKAKITVKGKDAKNKPAPSPSCLGANTAAQSAPGPLLHRTEQAETPAKLSRFRFASATPGERPSQPAALRAAPAASAQNPRAGLDATGTARGVCAGAAFLWQAAGRPTDPGHCLAFCAL